MKAERIEIERSYVEMVTPEKANKYLGKNKVNRKLSEPRVQYFAEMMASGQWHQTHQGLAITGDGGLLDGQHRCEAIVRTGKSQMMYVTIYKKYITPLGMPFDMGLPRTDSDILGYPKETVGIIKSIRLILHGKVNDKLTPMEIKYYHDIYSKAFTWWNEKKQTSKKIYSCMSVKAAVALRFQLGHDWWDNYHKMVLWETAGMDYATAVLFKYIGNIERASGLWKHQFFIATWMASDPIRSKDLKRIVIRDIKTHIDQIKTELGDLAIPYTPMLSQEKPIGRT